MATKSVAALVQMVRDEGEFLAPAHTTERIKQYLTDARAMLQDVIIAFDDSRLLKTDTVAVSSGTSAYNLPSDYYVFKGAAVEDSSSPDGWATMERFQWDERHDQSHYRNKKSSKYEIRDGQIHIWPEPNWNGNVLVEYIETTPDLTDPYAADVTLPNWHWLSWMVLEAAIHCAIYEESDPAPLERRMARVERTIRAIPQERHKPMTITSVYGNRREPRRRVRRTF